MRVDSGTSAKNQAIFQRFTHLSNDRFSLCSNRILSLFEDSNGKIWIGTDTGLNLYDPVNNQFHRFKNNPKNKYSLSNNVIYTIFEDMNHTLWLGTDYGLNFYDQANDHFWHINHNPSDPNSLSNDLIRAIYKDASGTIWVGTYGGGLNHYDWRKKKFRHFKNIAGDRNSINDNNVWSILISRSGHLWIGTNKGLNKINRNKNKVRVFRHNPVDPYSLGDDIVPVLSHQVVAVGIGVPGRILTLRDVVPEVVGVETGGVGAKGGVVVDDVATAVTG